MAVPLHLSSCLFATIVVHAYYRHHVVYHHAFLGLTVSSILFHTTHYELVRRLDKLLAHVCYIIVVTDTPKALAAEQQFLLCFPFFAACAWFAQTFIPSKKDELHLCLHLIGVVGMNFYLLLLY